MTLDPGFARTNKSYFDLAGRTTKTIENYVNGTVSDSDDKTVEYTYHANSQMKTLKAYLTSSTSETTEWILGITSPIVNPDMLLEMRYPDASTGASSSSEKDAFTYNTQGDVLTKTDRNGNVPKWSAHSVCRAPHTECAGYFGRHRARFPFRFAGPEIPTWNVGATRAPDASTNVPNSRRGRSGNVDDTK